MQLDPPPERVGLVTAVTLPSGAPEGDSDEEKQMGVWLDGNRHCIFGIIGGVEVLLTDLQLRHSVYVCNCRDIIVDVSAGKVNHITLDSCHNCVLRYDSCISTLDVVRCHGVRLVATGAGTELLQCDLSSNVTSEGANQPRNLIHSNNLSIRLADYVVPASPYCEQRWTYASSSADTSAWSTRSTNELRDHRANTGIVVLRRSTPQPGPE